MLRYRQSSSKSLCMPTLFVHWGQNEVLYSVKEGHSEDESMIPFHIWLKCWTLLLCLLSFRNIFAHLHDITTKTFLYRHESGGIWQFTTPFELHFSGDFHFKIDFQSSCSAGCVTSGWALLNPFTSAPLLSSVLQPACLPPPRHTQFFSACFHPLHTCPPFTSHGFLRSVYLLLESSWSCPIKQTVPGLFCSLQHMDHVCSQNRTETSLDPGRWEKVRQASLQDLAEAILRGAMAESCSCGGPELGRRTSSSHRKGQRAWLWS